jgi:cell division inhibitor SepF
MGEGLFGKFKALIGVEEIEEEEETLAAVQQTQPMAVGEQRRAVSPAYPERSTYDRSSTFVQPRMERKENKVVSMQNGAGKKQFKLVVIEPKSFDECPRLVDNLKSKKPVIINLEKLENEKARKIFDFLSGATYALDGNVQKVANNIFIFAPENVDVLSTLESGSSSTVTVESPWRSRV